MIKSKMRLFTVLVVVFVFIVVLFAWNTFGSQNKDKNLQSPIAQTSIEEFLALHKEFVKIEPNQADPGRYNVVIDDPNVAKKFVENFGGDVESDGIPISRISLPMSDEEMKNLNLDK